jgi:hypothetical protein
MTTDTAPLSAEKLVRYHLLDEAPIVVRTAEGERSLGAGWLVISEAEYAELARSRPAAEVTASRNEVPRPGSEWTEDDGDVLWFHYPICEPPWIGSPLSEDFDEDWYQWWTPLPDGNAIDAAIRALKSPEPQHE